MLHLFTGGAPYEELECISALQCPAPLVARLRKAWYSEGGSGEVTFTALQTVLEDDEDDILFHTL